MDGMDGMKFIDYRGEKISLNKAKGLLALLKIGVYNPKLNKEEDKEYSVWKEHYESMKEHGRNIRFPINEKGYLIWQLENYFNLGAIIKSAVEVYEEMRQPTGKYWSRFLHTEFTPASDI